MHSYLVTGGAGFIGSNLVHQLIASEPDCHVTVLDKLTYAGNPENLSSLFSNPRFKLLTGDIADAVFVSDVLTQFKPTTIFNLAAETHVDRSIEGPSNFIHTNIVGTFTLLESARKFQTSLSAEKSKTFKFVHISTDEVYGSLGDTDKFSENTPYNPNSPYSASKASSDHLVRAWHHTYGLPTIVTNCSNNYGPRQFPEKLIPLVILNALEDKPIPIYGDGLNVRDWLHVDDHCSALRTVAERGTLGSTYCIGGDSERTNLEVVTTILDALDRLSPSPRGPRRRLMTHVQDRPGHDRRYAIDATKIKEELGWRPMNRFEDGISNTVKWYLDNLTWCDSITETKYKRERLGVLNGGGQ